MLNILRFIASHGIDPEVPLILSSMGMGWMMRGAYQYIKQYNKENHHDKI